MGFRVSWIARAGLSTTELLEVSGRTLTSERHDLPDVGWYLLELPAAVASPWVLLIADGSDNFADLDEAHAQTLSQAGVETLYFWCSDTVMATGIVCYQNGKVVWSVDYDCEVPSRRPAITSKAPQLAHQILDDLRSRQEAESNADYVYDLTAELGRLLVDFRHDMDPKTDDPTPFQVLKS